MLHSVLTQISSSLHLPNREKGEPSLGENIIDFSLRDPFFKKKLIYLASLGLHGHVTS